jgi:uncharacterized protein (DUF885 family)
MPIASRRRGVTLQQPVRRLLKSEAPAAGAVRGYPTGMKSPEQRREQLKTAIADEWEYELRESPEFATMIGDYRYNDRWSDLSLAHIEERKRDIASWLARFETIDVTGLPEQEILDHTLVVRKLRESLEEFEFKEFEMPVDQMDGVHLMLAQFVSQMPFDSTKHYDDYLTRLRALPRVLDQVTELLNQGERDGLMPPRYLLEKTVAQCWSIAEPAGEANVFGRPVAEMPE